MNTSWQTDSCQATEETHFLAGNEKKGMWSLHYFHCNIQMQRQLLNLSYWMYFPSLPFILVVLNHGHFSLLIACSWVNVRFVLKRIYVSIRNNDSLSVNDIPTFQSQCAHGHWACSTKAVCCGGEKKGFRTLQGWPVSKMTCFYWVLPFMESHTVLSTVIKTVTSPSLHWVMQKTWTRLDPAGLAAAVQPAAAWTVHAAIKTALVCTVACGDGARCYRPYIMCVDWGIRLCLL